MSTFDLSRRRFLSGLAATTIVVAMPVMVAQDAAASTSVSAIKAALAGNFSEAGRLAQASGDDAAIKLVELLYLKDHGHNAGYARVMDFLTAAPNWPLTETLNKRAEQALYESGDTDIALRHFAKKPPLTPEGYLALARAHYTAGNAEDGKAALRKAWLNPEISVSLETQIGKEFAGQLSEADKRARLWRIIYAQESNAALRYAKKLGPPYPAIAKVAQALLRSEGGAEKKYMALPSAQRDIPALRYALARHYRKQEKYAKARAILAAAPTTAADMGDPEAWWTERRIIARRSIGPNHRDTWTTAYKIASQHGLSKGASAVEAEFLAGWIALRYLNKPDTAMKHFERLGEIAPSRTEKARALYWIGRTHAALGNPGEAKSAYKSAAQFSTVYYGQLAREQIGLGEVPEKIASGETTPAAKRKVDSDEVIRAFRLMHAASGKTHLYMFLWSLSNRFDTVEEMNAAAAIVHAAGGTTMALRFAKAAGQRNIDIDTWSYPIKGLPDWKTVGKPIEKALVFALSRQESEFDPHAGSKVGAQGLMQIMPGTAKLIARQHGLPYAAGKLTSDPAYNVKLGAAHMADLVDDFGGSYVLTLVAYNAGPRRAKEWVEEFGDLRSGDVDAIDWVESIPFQETRQYVQKVLQNLHIYRSRLAPHTVKPMSADLKRGSPDEITVASTSKAATTNTDCASIQAIIKGCN